MFPFTSSVEAKAAALVCSSSPMQRKSMQQRQNAQAVYVLIIVGFTLLILYQYSWRSALTSKSRQPVALPAKLRAPALQAARPLHSESAKPVRKGPRKKIRLPKLIHQTVRNRSEITCQQRKVINSWKALNPGYEHQIWDDSDIRGFILQYYPELVPIPFDEFLSGAERSDLWRVLVLHKLGGVYADMDVQCLKPIDDWNAEHDHDAQVLLGMENYDSQREHPIHVVNWVMAAARDHPLLGNMPSIVAKATQHQFFQAMKQTHPPAPATAYEAGIIDRTGPAALSWAMYEYFEQIGQNVSNITDRTVSSDKGFIAGGVRVLPIANMASGWEVAEARKHSTKYTCDDLAKRVPDAYVCHMFLGSWRANWYYREEESDCQTASA